MLLHYISNFNCLLNGLCLLTIVITTVYPTSGTMAPEYAGCILKQSNYWNDYLLVEWNFPEEFTYKTNQSDITTDASWRMEENVGTCSEVTMTSCKMIRRDNNSNLEHDFYLTVTITTVKDANMSATWRINTTDCRQPQKIDNVSATALNSSCTDLKWQYTRTRAKNGQYCTELLSKRRIYRIRYKESRQRNDSWNVRYVGPTNRCSGNQIICGLMPYTFYDVEADSRLVNNGTQYGHWSQTSANITRTDEDVPSVSPEMAKGGFSYVRQDCKDRQTRNVKFYWKTIPAEFRNGKILGYEITVYQNASPSTNHVQPYIVYGEESVTSSAALSCLSFYNVTVKAFTSKGTSKTPSSILIPIDNSVLDVDMDVVPVGIKLSDSVDIRWVFNGNITFDITSYTVFWCLKTLSRKCQSYFNWTELSVDHQHYLLETRALAQPLYKYLFGMSVQSNMSSSGITWSNCLFTEDKDVEPPKNVHVITAREKGVLIVQWDKPSCDGPYIWKYVVQLCPVQEATSNNCSDPLSEVVDGQDSDISFTGLDPAIQYEISVRAVTLSNITSVSSKVVRGRPFFEGSGLKGWQIAMIVVGVLALLAVVIVTVAKIRRLRRRFQQRHHINDVIGMVDRRLIPNGPGT